MISWWNFSTFALSCTSLHNMLTESKGITKCICIQISSTEKKKKMGLKQCPNLSIGVAQYDYWIR